MAKHSAGDTNRWSRPFSTRFHIIALIAALGAVALVSAGIWVNPTVATIAGTIVAIGTLIVTAGYKIQKIPQMGRAVCRFIIISTLVAEFAVGAIWLGSTWYSSTHDIDLRSRARLHNHLNMRSDISPASLDVRIPAERDGIELTFQVTDHNPALGICAPFTQLVVTPSTNGSSTTEISVTPGSATWIDIPPGTTLFRVIIIVKNEKNDTNCSVDLSISRAMLKDR